MHTCREMMSPALRSVQQQFLRWRQRCGTVVVTDSLQHRAVAALRSNNKNKSYEIVINLSQRHSKCFVSGSWNCNENCTLCGRGLVLDAPRHIGVFLLRK